MNTAKTIYPLKGENCLKIVNIALKFVMPYLANHIPLYLVNTFNKKYLEI